MEEVYNSVLTDNPIGSRFYELRRELNNILKKFLNQGENDKRVEKYLSVNISAENLEFARRRFIDIEAHLSKKFKDINKECVLTELDNNSKAGLLAQIFRGGGIPAKKFSDRDFSVEDEKGYIAPDSFNFSNRHFKLGKRFAKCIFLRDIPSSITVELIQSLLRTQIEQIITMNISPLETSRFRKDVDSGITNLRGYQLQHQYKAALRGIMMETTPHTALKQLEALNEWYDYIHNKKQNAFAFNMVVMFYGDSLNDLKIKEDMLQSKANELVMTLGSMDFRQEEGMQSVLPIGFNNITTTVTLPTEAVAAFIPFDRRATIQEGGFFYSLHADTKQAIVLNRANSRYFKTASGFVLGSSGSGKGMFVKPEIINIMLKTDDNIIILDPENEYGRLVNAFDGQMIELSPQSSDHINPFDIPIEDEDFANGVPAAALKLNLILSIIEAMIGGEVSPGINSLVDEILRDIYVKFMVSKSPEDLPTFKDFFAALERKNTPTSLELADVMRIYVTGSLSVFSHKTNIKASNRLICYNTNRLGEHLKPVASYMMFDAIWNTVAKNRNSGKRTWIYIDEVHLLFNSEDNIKRVGEMYRRFRKYSGIVTSMTQNTSDTIKYAEARSMLSNSDFIVVMNQKEHDRREIVSLLNIPPSMVGYITNAGKGEGIIFAEKALIPFSCLWHRNTKTYEMMTTRLS